MARASLPDNINGDEIRSEDFYQKKKRKTNPSITSRED
jgi:hypothetical protein